MNENLHAHFQTLRARVEAEVKPHSIIMVTSATTDDGARLTSFGLADVLAAAGHQTALVDATTDPAEARDGRFKTVGRRDFPIYSLPREGAASSRERDTIEMFSRQTREAFDYTIIDAPPFGRQSVTVTLASRVDVVLISLKLGRQPAKADDMLVRALGTAGTHVLGVVGVEPASLAHFEELGADTYIIDPHPRPASTQGATVTDVFPQIRIRQAR
jgi:Mrp family chromosome partitioning ATPase